MIGSFLEWQSILSIVSNFFILYAITKNPRDRSPGSSLEGISAGGRFFQLDQFDLGLGSIQAVINCIILVPSIDARKLCEVETDCYVAEFAIAA